MQGLRNSVLLILVGSLATLTSCGMMTGSSNNAQDNPYVQPVSITIVYAKEDLLHKQGISSVINAFEKSHPNIVIDEIDESWTGSYGEYLKMKEAVGEFPDLVELHDTQLFADAGLLHELQDNLTSIFKEPPKVNGLIYNLPLELPVPQGIIYSKAVFNKAGISAPPKTLGQFMEACDKIKRLGIHPIVIGGKDIRFWINKFLIDEVYIQNSNWNAERSEGKTSWTDPGPMKAMSQLASFWKQGYAAPGYLATVGNQTASYFVSGQAAMLFSGPWMFNQIKSADLNFEYGFFALPDENGKINVAGANTPTGWSISAEAAKDSAKLEAITQFIHYFYSEDQYPRYLQAVNGISSTIEEISIPQPEAMQDVIRVMNDPKIGKSMLMDEFSERNRPPSQFSDWFYETAQDWLTGNMSVEAAMKEADREWDALKE